MFGFVLVLLKIWLLSSMLQSTEEILCVPSLRNNKYPFPITPNVIISLLCYNYFWWNMKKNRWIVETRVLTKEGSWGTTGESNRKQCVMMFLNLYFIIKQYSSFILNLKNCYIVKYLHDLILAALHLSNCLRNPVYISSAQKFSLYTIFWKHF